MVIIYTKDNNKYRFDVKNGNKHRSLFKDKSFINNIKNIDIIVKSQKYSLDIPENVDDIKIGMLFRASTKLGGKLTSAKYLAECALYKKDNEEKKLLVYIENGECQIRIKKI